MTSLRSLKDRLSDLEDEETPSEIALSMFVTTINPDGPDGEELPIGAAMRWDRRINRRCSHGIEIYTDADREDIDRRLGSSIDTLADRDGVRVDRDEFLQYIAGRFKGEIPSGEAGVREHFGGDVSTEQVNQLWEWTVGQIPDPDDPVDQRPREVNRPIPEADE